MRSTYRLLILCSFLVLACAHAVAAADADSVLGVWKTVEKQGAEYGFVLIGKDRMRMDDEREIGIALDSRAGTVTVRRADGDEVLAVIDTIGADSIEIAFVGFGGKRIRFTRSSPEEMTAVLSPPLERILGFWLSRVVEDSRFEDKFVGNMNSNEETVSIILEIEPDSIGIDGRKTPVSIVSRRGVYVATREDGKPMGAMRILDDGTMRCDFLQDRVFIRATATEAEEAFATLEKFIARYHGFWRAAEPWGPNPYDYLEITETTLDNNGNKVDARPVRRGAGVVVVGEDGKTIFYSRVDMHDVLVVGLGGGRPFVRSNREELDKLNNPRLADFTGYWLLDEEGIESYRTVEIGTDYIVRDNHREAVVVADTRVNRLFLAGPEPGRPPLFSLARVDDDHCLMMYGDDEASYYHYRRVDKAAYAAAVAGLKR